MSRHLSPRMVQIVDLIYVGCSNKEISARLGITTKTVKTYLGKWGIRRGELLAERIAELERQISDLTATARIAI